MTITLPEAPAIPGLRFRGIRRPDDDAAIAELVNTSMKAADVPHRLSLAQITNWLDHASNLDLAADFLFAEVDGRVVAYAEGGWEQDNDGGRNYSVWGQVHPDWQRRGLGAALLHWVERRQGRIAASHPDSEKRLQSWADEKDAGRLALLEANGYQIVRYGFEMERPNLDDIPDLPLPAGIELRPAREEELRRYWETEVEVFRDHWGAIDDSEESFDQMRGDPRRDLSLWVIAWDGDEIAGQVLNRINHEANAELGMRLGWVNSVGVRRLWRRRGLARALVAESLRVLRDAGMTSAGLGVDAENPHGALGVYEASGFRVVRTDRVYRKPL
ncbi:MAG: GNAT family N-acetyltransferase [Candidatus Limnocylindria bacterium]